MSFLLDVLLLGIVLVEVVWYAKRTIFGALSGCVALALAAFAAFFLIGTVAPRLSDYVVTPLVEQAAANELADMYSAAHLSSGRETVAALPLGELVEQQPEAYAQLLNRYSVEPAAVRAAYEADPSPVTVLTALTQARATAISRAVVFVLLTALLRVLLGLIAGRVEQNFPPTPRYHGVKRLVPGLLGIVAGLIVLWVLVAVLSWIVPVLQGQILFLSEETLQTADGFSVLRRSDPFLLM